MGWGEGRPLAYIRVYIGGMCTGVLTACTQVHAEANRTVLHRAPPELWPRLGKEEVRGPSSEAVSAGVADTAAESAGAADSAAASAGAADSATVERGDGSYDSTNLFRLIYAYI